MKTSKSDASKKVLSLLLVDDDRLILSTMATGLVRAGYQVFTAESVDEAEEWLAINPTPDLAIVDINMPGRCGLELSKRLSELDRIPYIMLTASSEPEVIASANALGAMGYLVKPIEIFQIVPMIETAVARAQELKTLKLTQNQLQTALDADRSVSIAIGIVMDQYQINYNDASTLLRNAARSRQVKLIDLASNIINSRENLNLGNDA